MSTIKTISSNAFTSDNIFIESPVGERYLWKNLIIEKRISTNWIYEIYKSSILHDLILVLFSPVS